MANIFYQKLKCLLSVASNLLLAFVNASLLLHSFLKFAAKMHYVWQGVIIAISQQIHDVNIQANLHYVCQGTKKKTTLRPVVSIRCSVTCGLAKEVGRILKPLVGQSTHHVHSTEEFIEQIKDIKLYKRGCITLYHVIALFTLVPVGAAIQVIKNRLEQDTTLQHKTKISVQHIMQLLNLCPNSTYFLFQGQYYVQREGSAMGSPVCTIVANMYMEEFEKKALNTTDHLPRI